MLQIKNHKIIKTSISIGVLNSIKIGDSLTDESGKSGKVIAIEKVIRKHETHYYFQRERIGTVLIIVPTTGSESFLLKEQAW